MMHRSPILHVLLAILLALSPSVCPCGPKAAGSAASCCSSVQERGDGGCCGSRAGAHAEPARTCVMAADGDDAPDRGCERCKGNCKCKAARTMKAEAPTTAHIAAPAAVAMVFGFDPPAADLTARIRVMRIESRVVPRPVTTLLRQHCALTV